MKETGGMAFPNCAGNQIFAPGMTLRDYFAGQALAGLTAAHDTTGGWTGTVETGCAQEAYAIADAMIAERDKGE